MKINSLTAVYGFQNLLFFEKQILHKQISSHPFNTVMYWQKSRFLAILLIYACKGDCLGVSILFYSYPDGRGADTPPPHGFPVLRAFSL
jgi:hypothetical protein